MVIEPDWCCASLSTIVASLLQLYRYGMRYLNTKVKSVDHIPFTAWFLCQILETTWTSFFQTTRIQLHMALEIAGELANLQQRHFICSQF